MFNSTTGDLTKGMIDNGYSGTSRIKKRTVTKSKCYDEEGRLISEDEVEEIEYETGLVQPEIPQWWQNPVISYDSNSSNHKCMCETVLGSTVYNVSLENAPNI